MRTSLLMLAAIGASASDVPLVAAYPMEPDAADAARVVDAGGGGRHGRLLDGATYADGGHAGKALRLGGGKARASIPGDPVIDGLVADATITLWVRPEARIEGDSSQLVTKRTDWWMPKPFSIDWLANGSLQMSLHDGAWRNPRGGSLSTGAWHHIALTYRRGAQASLWLDGRPVSAVDAPRSLSRNGEPLILGFEPPGNFQGGNHRPFVGMIDDLRLYATALDATQVQQDMAGTLPTRPVAAADLPPRRLESTPPASARTTAPDAPLVCELAFDQEVSARGMWYEESATQVEEIDAGGKKVRALVCKGGSAPAVPHARSLRLSLLDPRFRDGRMPVVDVEVEYSHPHNAGVDVLADTARGGVRVANAWGGNDRFKTIRAQIDDARFASTDSGAADREVKPDGYDLRINAYSGDFRVRRVQVTGYELRNDPDWRRLLKLQGISAPGRDIFAFTSGEELRLDWRFSNLALIPADATWSWRMTGPGGVEHAAGTGTGACAPGGELAIAMRAPSRGLAFGVYEATLQLSAKRRSGVVEVLNRTVTFAIGSTATLGKAAPGEFLYGLDVSLGSCWNKPAYLAWMRWMGVDLVRGGASMRDWDKAMPAFRAQGLQVMPMPEAAYDANPDVRARRVREAAEQAAAVASRHPDIIWWEIGNEPDLGFYPGPIEDYAVGMSAIAKAIRTANPKAMPMNGGLSWFGADGERRSHRLVELAVPSELGALAYHGHGPLMKAEHEAYERMLSAMKALGKEGMTLIETESGVAAGRSPQQEEIQARTVVEKLVYGQSRGMPLFIFFRLHFEQANSYGMLHDEQQPRPSVLAYRALVERTRGMRCGKPIDLGDPGISAYPFTAGTRRCMVLWLERAETASASIALAASAAGIRDLRASDLYGNPLPVPPLAGPIATVDLADRPLFLCWDGAGEGFPAAAAPPLRIAGCEFAAGSPATMRLSVRNADAKPMTGSVRVRFASRTPVTPAETTLPVTVAAGAEVQLDHRIAVGAEPPAIAWPQTWTVFTGAPEAASDPTAYRQMPTEIATARARTARLQDGRLDLSRITGGHQERKAALCFAEIRSDAACTIEVGASADWWMEWAVNGERVYSTMETGNGSGFRITDHRLRIPLRPGINLLAVRVLSGSQGFVLVCGGPEELRRTRASDTDRVEAELIVGGTVVARTVRPLQLLLPLPATPAGGGRALAGGPPLAEMAEPEVTNLFVKHPDSSRWWRGDSDCSARTWFSADAARLTALVIVRDDVHRGDGPAATAAERDGIRLALHGEGWSSPRTWTIASIGGRPTAVRTDGAGDPAVRAVITRDDSAGTTTYEISLDRAGLAGGAIQLNLLVTDDDAGYRKQYMVWRPGLAEGIDASRWFKAIIR